MSAASRGRNPDGSALVDHGASAARGGCAAPAAAVIDGAGAFPGSVTPGKAEESETPLGLDKRFEVVAWGVDDVTFMFDMTGSRSLGVLADIPRSDRGWLYFPGSFGKRTSYLGRHNAVWRPDTSRLYVQAKLALEGALMPPEGLGDAYERLTQAMAFRGLYSYEPVFVTRLDVAVDVTCAPRDGKLLLDALAGVRLSRGAHVETMGQPRSTVYFKARNGRDVLARSYCRNLKTGEGEPFGKVRLEAQQRWKGSARIPLDYVLEPAFAGYVWTSRFGQDELSGRVIRLRREEQSVDLTKLFEAGVISIAQAERLTLFIDLERQGLAQQFYPRATYYHRVKEARALGLMPNEDGEPAIEYELNELLAPARSVWG